MSIHPGLLLIPRVCSCISSWRIKIPGWKIFGSGTVLFLVNLYRIKHNVALPLSGTSRTVRVHNVSPNLVLNPASNGHILFRAWRTGMLSYTSSKGTEWNKTDADSFCYIVPRSCWKEEFLNTRSPMAEKSDMWWKNCPVQEISHNYRYPVCFPSWEFI